MTGAVGWAGMQKMEVCTAAVIGLALALTLATLLLLAASCRYVAAAAPLLKEPFPAVGLIQLPSLGEPNFRSPLALALLALLLLVGSCCCLASGCCSPMAAVMSKLLQLTTPTPTSEAGLRGVFLLLLVKSVLGEKLLMKWLARTGGVACCWWGEICKRGRTGVKGR